MILDVYIEWLYTMELSDADRELAECLQNCPDLDVNITSMDNAWYMSYIFSRPSSSRHFSIRVSWMDCTLRMSCGLNQTKYVQLYTY